MVVDEFMPTDCPQSPTNGGEHNQFGTTDPNELLIMLVESKPSLWDHQLDPALRTLRAKTKLWEEIANTPGIKGKMSVKEVKAKWKSLFDNYRAMVQKEQYDMKKSGSAALLKKPKWAYYDIMSFAQDRCLVTQTFLNRPGRLVSNDESDEENREVPIHKDIRKGRRNKNKTDYEESSIAALMLIAEKMDSSMPELPAMPELDGIDHALAVISNNCRKAPAALCQKFLQKIVDLSFNISLNIDTEL